MALAAGTRLGPYEIVAPLGAGGMGEVYRAKDTRLGRDVAVKVLPSHLSASAEVRARFEREARAVSSLNHPHICTLHDVGREGDTDYLVMELVDGETLAERLARGALPLADVLRIGGQIADALNRAHRAGVVHRDLKPGNVMLTKTGAKLLDFGLAAAARPADAASSAGALTNMPTMTSPLTTNGMIIGTLAYMAPEQLEGKETDARADLWSLGCVLYEMATGRRPFEGASQASLITSIMSSTPPPLPSLAPLTPPALERIVRQCLAKDPDERWQNAGDLGRELKWLATGSQDITAAGATGTPETRHGSSRLPWLVAGIAVLAALAAFVIPRLGGKELPAPPMRFAVTAPAGLLLSDSANASAISPDGRWLVFTAADSSGRSSLWLRELAGLTARPLAGTENALIPFWSPDSRRLGFFSDGRMKKVAIAGGSPEVICAVPDPRGACWGPGGDIIFSPSAAGALWRVSADGGEAVEILRPDAARKETAFRFPEFLPDGRHFTFVVLPVRQNGYEIHLGSLGSTERTLLTNSDGAVLYAPPGYLLLSRNGRLLAQPFDARSLKLTGKPITVGEAPIVKGYDGASALSISSSGVLSHPNGVLSNTVLVLLDRSGRRLATVPAAVGRYVEMAVAPDGQHAVVSRRIAPTEMEMLLLDLARGTSIRLPAAPSNFLLSFVWSPDGRQYAFGSNTNGPQDIFVRTLDPATEPELAFGSDNIFKNVHDWTPDGKHLLFEQPDPETGWDIWMVPLEGERRPVPVARSRANEGGGWISPDGRWVAYRSDESGRDQIYAQAFPVATGRQQLTTNGVIPFSSTSSVSWSADGSEVLVQEPDGTVRSIDVRLGDSLQVGASRVLFQSPPGLVYLAPSEDHQRFLASIAVGQAEPPSLSVVLNWMQGTEAP
ncbi:MAG: protein kinase [bacterium]|nr:protein kinase [bacterium]